jgi:precorrin-6B methylase 2
MIRGNAWSRVKDVVDLDVVYIPTPKSIVRQMLLLTNLRRGEVLFDLGAGDARILIEAARKFGAKVTGIEIDPERIARAKERLTTTRTSAELIQGDFMGIALSPADVVTMYLSESVNAKLAPKLRSELKSGSRIVSLDYDLPGWTPERERLVSSGGVERKLYLYRA